MRAVHIITTVWLNSNLLFKLWTNDQHCDLFMYKEFRSKKRIIDYATMQKNRVTSCAKLFKRINSGHAYGFQIGRVTDPTFSSCIRENVEVACRLLNERENIYPGAVTWRQEEAVPPSNGIRNRDRSSV